MTITAEVIADSVSPEGIRITSVQLRYPRFIHAELMTHRVFSRNASSSRAIPVEKLIEDLRRDPAMPVYWGSNQKGMQAGAEISNIGQEVCRDEWLEAMNYAIYRAQDMVAQGLHKQIANRILEPWAHINVLVTSTSWANFFALRRHPDAQPEIKVLADRIYEAMEKTTPQRLYPGQWHLPYISGIDAANAGASLTAPNLSREDVQQQAFEILKKVSVARCARVSYLTHDRKPTRVRDDLELYNRLVGSQPLHASPAEHQATPDEQWNNMGGGLDQWKYPELHGNFTGWKQLRKMLPGEYVED